MRGGDRQKVACENASATCGSQFDEPLRGVCILVLSRACENFGARARRITAFRRAAAAKTGRRYRPPTGFALGGGVLRPRAQNKRTFLLASADCEPRDRETRQQATQRRAEKIGRRLKTNRRLFLRNAIWLAVICSFTHIAAPIRLYKRSLERARLIGDCKRLQDANKKRSTADGRRLRLGRNERRANGKTIGANAAAICKIDGRPDDCRPHLGAASWSQAAAASPPPLARAQSGANRINGVRRSDEPTSSWPRARKRESEAAQIIGVDLRPSENMAMMSARGGRPLARSRVCDFALLAKKVASVGAAASSGILRGARARRRQ